MKHLDQWTREEMEKFLEEHGIAYEDDEEDEELRQIVDEELKSK